MKPTDEERREAAENLRTMCVCGCRYAEQFYELLNETVMDAWDFHDFHDVADRLADLIEPAPERTCRMANARYTDELLAVQEEVWATPEDTVAFRCGACGFVFRYERGVVPRYCPDCGAKVVG